MAQDAAPTAARRHDGAGFYKQVIPRGTGRWLGAWLWRQRPGFVWSIKNTRQRCGEPCARPAGKMPAARSGGSWKAPCSFRTFSPAMNLVGQPFQAAGSTGFPARRTHWGLESPQNRQARKPALQGRGSWEVSTRSRPPPGRLRATAVTFRKRPRREPATVATSRNRTERQSSTVATSSHWPREFPATVATFDHQPGRFCATVATSRNQLGEFPSTVATSRNRRRTFFPTVATSSKPPGRFFATCGTCQQ